MIVLNEAAYGQVQNLFKARYLKDNQGDILPYRILSPEQLRKGKKYPLVLFYHGSGERGNDNFSQLKWGVRHFATKKIRRRFPAYVVVPQCPEDSQWVNINYDNFPVHLPLRPSPYIALSIELIRYLEQKYSYRPESNLCNGHFQWWIRGLGSY